VLPDDHGGDSGLHLERVGSVKKERRRRYCRDSRPAIKSASKQKRQKYAFLSLCSTSTNYSSSRPSVCPLSPPPPPPPLKCFSRFSLVFLTEYFPDPILLRKSINFEKIPSLESILQRNRDCGLEMFGEGAEERIIAEIGKSEPPNITQAMQKMEGLDVEPTPISTHDTILTISVYHSEKHTKTEEFLCLGSQSLSLLRDKIYCLSDRLESQVGIDSGFFFIEGVFYNDMRGETSRDYSHKLIKWAQENGNWSLGGFPEMRSGLMESAKWDSIPLRVGAQYCYCHCGDCEHIIIVDSIRLVQEDDYPNANAYPLRTFRSKNRRRKCQICNVYPSKHVCHDDIFMDGAPYLCCTRCFTAMHYRSDESLKYEVESYKYEHE
jgi:snRNA-activating protein complex subunit 3